MLEVRCSDDVHIVTRTQYIGVKTQQKKKLEIFNLDNSGETAAGGGHAASWEKTNNIHLCAEYREVKSRESLASHM